MCVCICGANVSILGFLSRCAMFYIDPLFGDFRRYKLFFMLKSIIQKTKALIDTDNHTQEQRVIFFQIKGERRW